MQRGTAGRAEDVVDVVVLAPVLGLAAAVMAVVPEGQPGARPVPTDSAANIDTYSADGLLAIHYSFSTSSLRFLAYHLCRKHPAHPQSYRKRILLNSGSSAPRARPVPCNLLHVSPEAISHRPPQPFARRDVGRERYELAGHGIKRSAPVEHNSSGVGRILREHGCQS